MKLHCTRPALHDFDFLCAFIAEYYAIAAQNVSRTICAGVELHLR